MQPSTGKVFANATISAERLRGKALVITELDPHIDQATSDRFGTPADDARVTRAAAALAAHGMNVVRAADAAEARRIVLGLIPDGADVYHGASRSLEVTGITEAIEQSKRYEPLRPQLQSMDRETEADDLRRLSAAPDVMLGSVHAVTEDGSLITASMGGGQLGPYVSGAGRVILVVGTQKIVADLARASSGSTSTPCPSRMPGLGRRTASTAP